MGIGVSIFLMAIGAVLTFAVSATAKGFNFDAIGVVLMIVGAIGLVVAMIVGSSQRGDDVTVVEEGHHHHA